MLGVVDDDAVARQGISRLLRSAGYDVVLYGSGAALLESLSRHPLRCIVLDLSMPEISGIDVLQALRRDGHNIRECQIFCV